jgi:hypothetical protein
MRPLLILAVALLTLPGCGEDSAATLGGSLSYVRSGGLAGETQELTIQRDGRATVTSDLGGADKASDFMLTDSERDQVAGLVQEADLATLEARKTPPVADGYAYELTYGGRTIRWEMGATPERAAKLVRILGGLAEKHRP